MEQRFNLDNSNPNHLLTPVSPSLNLDDVNGSVSVQLFSGGTVPPSLLTVLNGPGNLSAGISTYTPSTPINLQGSGSFSAYWVIVSGAGYGWNLASVPLWDGHTYTEQIDWLASYNHGAGTVDSLSGGADEPKPGDSLPYELGMYLDTFPFVPEPSTLAMVGLGLAAVFLYKRRHGAS